MIRRPFGELLFLHKSSPIPPLSQTEENNVASSFSTFFNNKIIKIHQSFESIQQDMRRVKNCSLTEKPRSCDVVKNELTMDTQSTTHETITAIITSVITTMTCRIAKIILTLDVSMRCPTMMFT